MPKINLSVSVDEDHLKQFSEVARRLRDAGMNIEKQMDKIGVISGSIDSGKVHVLKGIKGVAHVEQSRSFQIPPPDSSVQ